MIKTEILSPFYSPAEVDHRWKQKLLTRDEVNREGYRFFGREGSPLFRTPEGQFVAWLMPNLFTDSEQRARAVAWQKMKGSLANRQSVFLKEESGYRYTKDGKLTSRMMVRPEVLAKTKGAAIKIGTYRENKSIAGKADCHLTQDSYRFPEIFVAALHDARRLTAAFRTHLPEEYGRQMEYINSVPKSFRLSDTAYTTVYGLRNYATACHRDEGDIPTGTGVLTTCGAWDGNEFILPEFKLAFDLRPSAALFVDVHRLHGNLPKTQGDRIAQVYFGRAGMEKCGDLEMPVALAA